MPHLDIKAGYEVTLTGPEFRLVVLALAGKLSDTDKADALQLNIHLCHLRAKMLKDAGENANKALENAIKLQQAS